MWSPFLLAKIALSVAVRTVVLRAESLGFSWRGDLAMLVVLCDESGNMEVRNKKITIIIIIIIIPRYAMLCLRLVE